MHARTIGVSLYSVHSDRDVPPLWSLLNNINDFQKTEEMFGMILIASRVEVS